MLMSEVLATEGFEWQGYYSDISLAGGGAFMAYFKPNAYECEQLTRVCFADGNNGIPCCDLIGDSYLQVEKMIMTSRSHHSGGVSTLLADGSARFMSNAVDLFVWRDLSATKSGQTASDF
jgi:hypothetical protein